MDIIFNKHDNELQYKVIHYYLSLFQKNLLYEIKNLYNDMYKMHYKLKDNDFLQ